MAGTTRQSARLSQNSNSSPPSAKSASGGTKRKAAAEGSSPSKAKRGRPSKTSKEQKTLEETMPDVDEELKAEAAEMEDVEGEEANGKAEDAGDAEDAEDEGVDVDEGEKEATSDDSKEDAATNAGNDTKHEESAANVTKPGDFTSNGTKTVTEDEFLTNGNKAEEARTETTTKTGTSESKKSDSKANEENAFDMVKADEGEPSKTRKEGDTKEDAKAETSDVKADAVEEDKERAKAMPSNILEKGIVYFFVRGRVNVDDPNSIQDLARSFFVLRPLPHGAKLTDGAIQDVGNNRLLALPKKCWPKSGKDRFMVFVEKAQVTMDTLKEEFFSGSEYATKTVGTRQTPEVTPIGEGVYAITSTGGGQGTTHLTYMLTIPKEIGEVQKDVGLAEKGSFVLSLKNPESPGPANAQLPHGADYPKEIIEEFGGRGWMPVHPRHLDYANAQMLLIGEDFDTSANLDPVPKDEKDDTKETPQEELEKLESEDEIRVENLKGDDTIFADLGISSEEYPDVKTTW